MSPVDPPRVDGTLSTWNDERGFGFLTPDAGGPTVWVHITSFRSMPRRPVLGDVVSFEIERRADGARRANNVEPVKLIEDARPKKRFWHLGWDSLTLVTIPVFSALVAFVIIRWHFPVWISWLYLALSLLCYLAYSADKSAATGGGWRRTESSLLVLGFIGGWPGAIVAQQVLRHKTRKRSYISAFWATVGLHVIIVIATALVIHFDVIAQLTKTSAVL